MATCGVLVGLTVCMYTMLNISHSCMHLKMLLACSSDMMTCWLICASNAMATGGVETDSLLQALQAADVQRVYQVHNMTCRAAQSATWSGYQLPSYTHHTYSILLLRLDSIVVDAQTVTMAAVCVRIAVWLQRMQSTTASLRIWCLAGPPPPTVV